MAKEELKNEAPLIYIYIYAKHVVYYAHSETHVDDIEGSTEPDD